MKDETTEPTTPKKLRKPRKPSKYMVLQVNNIPNDLGTHTLGFVEIGQGFQTIKAGWAFVTKEKVVGKLLVVCVRQVKTAAVQETLVLK